MLLAFLRPGVLSGANGDDQYLQRVRLYGDTTDVAAQLQALASYSIEAEFTQRASFRTLEMQIAAGIPVPCGYLGTPEKPDRLRRNWFQRSRLAKLALQGAIDDCCSCSTQ